MRCTYSMPRVVLALIAGACNAKQGGSEEVFQDPNASFGMFASVSDPGKCCDHAKTGIEILRNFLTASLRC